MRLVVSKAGREAKSSLGFELETLGKSVAMVEQWSAASGYA